MPNYFQKEKEIFQKEKDTLREEKDTLREEKDTLHEEKYALHEEKDTLLDQLKIEKATIEKLDEKIEEVSKQVEALDTKLLLRDFLLSSVFEGDIHIGVLTQLVETGKPIERRMLLDSFGQEQSAKVIRAINELKSANVVEYSEDGLVKLLAPIFIKEPTE